MYIEKYKIHLYELILKIFVLTTQVYVHIKEKKTIYNGLKEKFNVIKDDGSCRYDKRVEKKE